MHNYYNILPTILIDVFIILVFEGLLFFLYLDKQQEKIIKNQLNTVKNNNPTIANIINSYNNYVNKSKLKEKHYNETQYKLGIILFCAVLVLLVIILLIYSYVVIKVLHKTLDWNIILITVSITILLIIIMELLYVKYVLFNKKFNESQIKLDFINAIII